jgi:hypothetical protein
VADDVEAVGILVGDDGELRVALDQERGVDQTPSTRPASAALARPAPILVGLSTPPTKQ